MFRICRKKPYDIYNMFFISPKDIRTISPANTSPQIGKFPTFTLIVDREKSFALSLIVFSGAIPSMLITTLRYSSNGPRGELRTISIAASKPFEYFSLPDSVCN